MVQKTGNQITMEGNNEFSITQNLELSEIEKLCCRVCFESMTQSQIFKICRCKGSNLQIHKRCLLQWIQKSKAIRSFMGHPYFQCEICRDSIFLELKCKRKIVTAKQMREKLCDKSICYDFIIALMLHMVLFAIAFVYFWICEKDMEKKTVIYMAVFSMVFILLIIIAFVYKSVVKEETVSIGLEQGGVWKVEILKKASNLMRQCIQID